MNALVRVSVICFFMLSLFVTGLVLTPSEAYAGTCPQGSYQRSCGPYACDANSITATCKRINGKWTGSKLNLPCSNDIANCDGTLRCLCGTECPLGSYKKSCWCCYIEQGNLYCFCKNKKGKSISTSLGNYGGCKSNTIWNDNGQLKCNR